MNTIKYILISFFLVTVITGCDDYLDINDDPNAPSDVSLDLRLKPVILLANGAGQWRATREVSAITQYVASRQEARTIDTWDFNSAYFFWQNSLVWVYPNAVDLIVMGEDQNSPHFTGVGKIFKSFLLLSMSDQYGKMPWEDLYDGRQATVLTPRFIDQEIIYENCLNLLDEAITDLSSTENSIALNNRSGDIMYEGDIQKWIKFAYALKARYLNHYTKKSTLYNPDAVIEACNKAFSSEQEDAQFNYTAGGESTQANPWSDEGYGGFQSATTPRYGSYSNFFVNLLKSSPLSDDLIDPRLSIIMNPAENTGEFSGIVTGRGYDDGKELADYSIVPGGFYSKADSPFPFITYSEVKFIEAEAKLRKGDVGGSMDAFKDGVIANMRKLGVEAGAISTASSKMDALTPDDFRTGADITPGLKHIMTQKYISMVFNPETWVDMRRMDYSDQIYPGLTRPENVNSIFEDGEWIRAMCYERNEENRNGDNLPDNRPEIRLRTPVWWDIAE